MPRAPPDPRVYRQDTAAARSSPQRTWHAHRRTLRWREVRGRQARSIDAFDAYKYPAVQFWHAVLPEFGVYLPGSHCRHDCSPYAGLYDPGKHGVGSAEPTAHDVPAGQMVQSLVRLLRKPCAASTA